MYLSEREVQRSLDQFRERQYVGQRVGVSAFSPKEIEGIKQIVKKLGGIPPIRQDRVERA